MPIDLYNHIWEGEPLEFNEAQVINIDLFNYYDKIDFNFDEVYLCADTAYSKKESADFSVIGCFGAKDGKVYFLRLYRGRWDFNELLEVLKSAYEWSCDTYQAPKNVIIEKAMVAEGAVIKDNAVIKSDSDEITVISEYEVVEGKIKVEA